MCKRLVQACSTQTLLKLLLCVNSIKLVLNTQLLKYTVGSNPTFSAVADLAKW